MKNIKILSALSVCLFTTGLLHAQELAKNPVTTQPLKTPQQSTPVTGTASAAPQFVAMDGKSIDQNSPAATTNTSSTSKDAENKTQPLEPKTKVLSKEEEVSKKLSVEQQKVLSGAVEIPKLNSIQPGISPQQTPMPLKQ